MSNLREWLDQQTLIEETITIQGQSLLLKEVDLAERGRELSKHQPLTDEVIHGVMCSLTVRDPETKERVVEPAQWQYWSSKGSRLMTELLTHVLRVNGLKIDEDAEVKNLEPIET